jgi:GT2 family glycosyltransferase
VILTNSNTAIPGALRIANLSEPSAVRSLDISAGFEQLRLPRARSGEPYRALAALVRQAATPLGWIDLPVPATGVVPAAALRSAFEFQLARPEALAAAGTEPQPAAEHAESSLVSVIVTTCADPAASVPCVRAVIAAASGSFEVIVVENRPAGSSVAAALAQAFAGDERVRYVEEPRPGLSRARNTGLLQARGEIVAFIDDDVTMDPHWFESTRAAFGRRPDAACVTGLILPLEFETPAQLIIQRMAAFEKGFAPRVYSITDPPADQPLFPYTAGFFGSGANMAFRRSPLQTLGGFDAALGAGSVALGGEDLDIYIRLLLSGRTLVYEPGAIVWHRHPETAARLPRQALHYGIGLGAMATKQLLTSDDRRDMLGRVPSGLRYLLSSDSRKNSVKGEDYPRRLEWLERLGLVLGPISYLRSRAGSAGGGRLPALPQGAAAGTLRRTVWCGELDVASPLLAEERMIASDGRPFDEARMLVRIHGEPAGFVHVPLADGRIEPDAVWEAIESRLSEQVQRHLDAHETSTERLADGADVTVSVIVCTRDRPEELRGCLATLQCLRHANLELLVVDNAPSDDRTERLIAELSREDPRLRYLCEPRPGLSCARNHGLTEARGEIIAYTDDDVRVDSLWLAGLLRGFRRALDVGCVTGLVASASLEHPAEQYFDGRVWWSSSCDHRLYRARRGPGDSRLHPYAAGMFGTGANIAFRADVIRQIGGFDESLGAGSPTAGGEDLDAFVRLLRAGYSLSYEPAALAWHEHRVDEADLQRQMYGYGKGLAAYLTKHLISWRSGPRLTARLLLALRHALVLGRRSRAAADETGVPPGLLASELRGLLAGPRAYLGARRKQTHGHLREVSP